MSNERPNKPKKRPIQFIPDQPFQEQKRVSMKQVGLWAYTVVVVVVLVSLVLVLNSEDDVESGLDLAATDAEIHAVLKDVTGSVAVPISNLEDLLPVKETLPAWQRYSAAATDHTPFQIAIVIDDLGLDEDLSKQFALFEGPLTLAMLPYADNLPKQAELLTRAGHELLVHLPMEPKSQVADPGPNALVSDVSFEEFERRIAWNLSRFEGFVGINNHMGSLMTEMPGPMVRVMVNLRKEGYLFLDSLTSPNSVGARAALATGVPHIARDVFLDNVRDIPLVLEQLQKTERIARQRGYAIAIGHPYPSTIKAMQFWLANLDRKQFSLVPISQLIAQKTKAEQLADASPQTDTP